MKCVAKLVGPLALLGLLLGSPPVARAQQANFWIAIEGDGSAAFPHTLTGMTAFSLMTVDGCINNSCLTCYDRTGVPGNATLALTAGVGHQYVLRGFYTSSAQVVGAKLFHDGNETPLTVTSPEGDVTVTVADTIQHTIVLTFGDGASLSSKVIDVCATETTTTTVASTTSTEPGATTSTTTLPDACAEGTAPACAGACPIGQQCAAAGASCACKEATVVGRFVSGSLTIRRSTGELEEAVPRTDFYEGDVLESDTGALLLLSDGSFARVRPGSRLVARVGEAPSNVVVRMIRGIIRIFAKPNPTAPRLDVATDNVSVTHTGTVYDVSYDDAALTSAIAVAEGAVRVTPTDSAIAPFDLTAGSRVEVAPAGVGATTPLAVVCAPQSGTAKKAGKPAKVKVRCTNNGSTAAPVTVSGVASESCTLRKPVSKTIKPGRAKVLKARVKCSEAGAFFGLTIDGVAD